MRQDPYEYNNYLPNPCWEGRVAVDEQAQYPTKKPAPERSTATATKKEPTSVPEAGDDSASVGEDDNGDGEGDDGDDDPCSLSQLTVLALVAFPLSAAVLAYFLWFRHRAPSAPSSAPLAYSDKTDLLESMATSSTITWRDVGAIWMVCCITSKLLRVVTGSRSDFDV